MFKFLKRYQYRVVQAFGGYIPQVKERFRSWNGIDRDGDLWNLASSQKKYCLRQSLIEADQAIANYKDNVALL